MIHPLRSLVLGVLACTVLACDKTTYIGGPTAPGQVPAAGPAPPVLNTIQFRVIGNANAVRVRYSTPADGLAQTVTTLPYFNSFTTSATSLFLSLDVTPTGYPMLLLNPFLGAQIVVNDTLFREATASDLTLATLSASGTWRR